MLIDCIRIRWSVSHGYVDHGLISTDRFNILAAEEVQDASIIVPWCIISTILINGSLGLAAALAFSFCSGDLEAALSSPTGYDLIAVFQSATNSNAGASIMTAIIITLVICATFGFLASASRLTWAFCRDRGLPFSEFFAHVSHRFSDID